MSSDKCLKDTTGGEKQYYREKRALYYLDCKTRHKLWYEKNKDRILEQRKLDREYIKSLVSQGHLLRLKNKDKITNFKEQRGEFYVHFS